MHASNSSRSSQHRDAGEARVSSVYSRELEGKVALVTGAAGGIGKAVVAELLGHGAHVVGLDLEDPFEDNLSWLKVDVSRDEDVQSAVGATVESFGHLDYLVHAAGIARDGVVWKLPVEDWDLVQRVNLRSAFLLLRHTIPAMRRGKQGRIVLIGSINGSRGKFGQTAYAASKAGLLGLAKSAAKETARFGIRVNVIEPGMVNTPMTRDLPEEVRAAAEAEILLGQLAEPSDIARAVRFLLGAGGQHITGQVLRVDGGQYL
jgi:3-oxoacyl-[acyl-carrier protein] reductase